MHRVPIILSPEEAFNPEAIRSATAKALGRTGDLLGHFIVDRRALDARRGVKYQLWVNVYEAGEQPEELQRVEAKEVKNGRRVLILGAGPTGLFAALRCLELGLKPMILERGKDVRARRRDLAALQREGVVNTESNYCFGEGGAGTYSDGKLYTRSTKRGDIRKVLEWLVEHGATPEILIEAHPHIGTNKLPAVISSIKDHIIGFGGEVHFEARIDAINYDRKGFKSIRLENGSVFEGEALILAPGHSAGDLYRNLHEQGVYLEAKPFALGVRIEHPQTLIDQIQYKLKPGAARSEFLPPASYRVVAQASGRGVYSFCMCPGGVIAPCSTEDGTVVTNGWSPSKRNNPFANSGLVVELTLEDILGQGRDGVMAGLEYRDQVERRAFEAGGGKLVAPAQRASDFINKKLSQNLPGCSYYPGLQSTSLDEVLPGFVAKRLREGLQKIGQSMRGYLTEEAVLVATESRTSSPIRIPRDDKTLMHPQIAGLFPAGEGAGYAGGIVSAAMDGIKAADATDSFLRLVK